MKKFEDKNLTLESFANNILTLCPNGDHVGVVKSDHDLIKFTCKHCGSTKLWQGSKDQSSSYRGLQNAASFGAPIDPYFKHNLYLQINFRKNVLFAFNSEHLQYIKDFVASGIRERSSDQEATIRNKTMISRLPKWMQSSKNREEILKKIKLLENKLKDLPEQTASGR